MSSHVSQQQTPAQESAIRRQKVEQLKQLGIDPWQAARPVDSTITQLHERFSDDQPSEQPLRVAGRMMTLRDHGKTFFANLHDRTGSLQLYIKKDLIGDERFEFFKKFCDLGDIIWASGTLFRTKKGEVTLKVDAFELQSKCLHPLPEKYHGLSDVEQRYRQRYLDLMSNPESKRKFVQRSTIVQALRTLLQEQSFLEVETPMLHPIPGGATARPFITHHNTYDIDLYLRIAPELYLKRLIVGGLERVFEINRNFRNEGVSTRHNPEFTMLELYQANATYEHGMDLTEQLLRAAAASVSDTLTFAYNDQTLDFGKPFARMTVEQAVQEVGGFTDAQLQADALDATLQANDITPDADVGRDEKIYALFEQTVESKLMQPTFITHFPIAVSPLARRSKQNPEVADRFELFVGGMELANAFTELTDPIDQAQRFTQQLASREKGDDEAHHFDADYVTALEYGMAPSVGIGIGIDRLVMLLTDTQSIKDVILFPTLKPRE